MTIKDLGASASPLLRKATPSFVFSGLRSGWHGAVRAIDKADEARVAFSYLLHRAKGGTFQTWYNQTLNKWASDSKNADIATARKDQFLMESGQEDLALIKEFGLLPTHTFLECGCGWLRAANYFINYLEPGNYFGNDPAGERIRIGRQIFAIRNIEERQPQFFVNEDNSLDWMEGKKVDFIWCHAVFGHLPNDDCEDIIKHMPKVMHEGSVFLFTYNPIPDARDEDPTERVKEDVRNFLQPSAFFRQVCEKYGMTFEDHRDVVAKYNTFGVKEGLGVARLRT